MSTRSLDRRRADAVEGGIVFVADPMAAFAAAEAKLTKALSSVPDHARGHMYLGFVDICTKRAAQGIAECEHALALDRNLADAHSFIGLGKIYVGRAEETEAHIAEALRLSPRDTMAYIWMITAGLAKICLGSWEQAVAWFQRSIEANRNHPYAYFVLGAALAQLGRLDEAHSAVEAGLAFNPSFTVSRVRVNWTALGYDPTYPVPSLNLLSRACAKPEFPSSSRRPPRRIPPRQRDAASFLRSTTSSGRPGRSICTDRVEQSCGRGLGKRPR